MRFTTLTRFQGKCLIRVEGVVDEGVLQSRSHTPDGRPLPSRLVRTETGDIVVVIPVTSVSQRVSVCVQRPDGEIAEVAHRVVGSLGASVRSKLNSALRNPHARRLRTSTVITREDGIAVATLFVDGDEKIIRGSIVQLLPEGDERLLREVEVSALDVQDGRALSDGWVCLGDSTRSHPDYPGIYERALDFSLRVPRDASEMILWARDADTGETIGFVALYSEWVDSLTRHWEGLLHAADRDERYGAWAAKRDAASPLELSLQRRAQGSLPMRPMFSFVVPLFHTPLDFLHEMVESVLAQTYPEFELLLVNASPEDADLVRAIDGLVAQDGRIRHVPLEGNRGITENTNEGIRAATGDFLVFLDHDDTIEPDALYWYAYEVSAHPDTDLIYCDEDHLKDGAYVGPFFKPDWDPDLLCSENYVCHMLSVRRSVVMGLPSLPGSEFDGSQDHNLTFLVGERARRVAHVSRILYHWRIHDRSVAGGGIDQKPYALEAEVRAVQNHLDRTGVSARAGVSSRLPMRCELTYEFFVYPLVSIIIPNHDAAPVLRRCLDSLLSLLTWPNFEIVVVENGSRDAETFALYDGICGAHGNVRVVTCDLENGFNFSRLVNAGVDAAKGEYLLLLNNDTEVITPDLLELMMGAAMSPVVGCVGAKLLYRDGLIQHDGVSIGRSGGPKHIGLMLPDSELGYYETHALPHRQSAVTAACLLVSRSVFEEVGGFDEGLPVDYNDVDFCQKVRAAGYSVVQQTNAKMYHYESVSRGSFDSRTREQRTSIMRSLGTYTQRWGAPLMLGDPYYNKNFAFENVYCGLETDRYPGGEPSLANFV